MKKLLILLSMILFGISASVSQGVYTVRVTWDDGECDCQGTNDNNYFKVTIQIIDVANGNYEVVKPTTEYTEDGYAISIDFDVSEIGDYCVEEHDYPPSFTVYAWVWKIESSSPPPGICCSGSDVYDNEYTCHQFYNGIITLSPEIELQ